MKVVICDDQAIVRQGLAMLLRLEPEIEVVGLAADGAAALALVEQTRPDLVLMDLMMPVMNGIQATQEIRDRFPATAVLILTTYDADEWVFDALRAGAVGYMLKDATREAVVAAVKGTVSGKTFLDPSVAGKVVARATGNPGVIASVRLRDLSERELAVLRLLGRGRTNTEIAERLHLADGTVRNLVSSLLSKLEVADRTQAALLAVQYGVDE
jgi:NarL family two-component system response regulator LiaR